MESNGDYSHLTPKTPLKLADVVRMKNVCDALDDEFLNKLGIACGEGYDNDLRSRTEWDRKMADAQKLAMQIAEPKTFPWAGASNVKFPLITIAAIQYHARAYPALVQTDDLVRYKVYGKDEQGSKAKLGELISQHMTWQLTEQDTEWEEGTDRALLVQPIMGCAFKKTYFNFEKKKNVSMLVLPKDLVLDYYCKDLDSAERISHVFEMTRNQCHTRKVAGLFRDVEFTANYDTAPVQQQDVVKQKSTGQTPPVQDPCAPYVMVEQQAWIDLDGDGYREPYVVTFERDSRIVARVVARFTTQDITYGADEKTVQGISAQTFYTKYPFIPSPDGGIYDLGFGILLSPLTRSIDSLINQMIDAGTLSNTAGGFLGKGIKLRGGQFNFKPFGWTPIDTVGDDIGKNIFPLPVRPPSDQLFRLMAFLVEYGERICSATETNVGISPGQNTPAETSRNVGEAGIKVLSAIFKRTWRAMAGEFRKLYSLNASNLDFMPPNPFGVTSQTYMLDPLGVRPAADPYIMSDAMRLQQAKATLEVTGMPGLGGNVRNAAIRVLKALKVHDIEEVLPDPQGPNAVPQGPSPQLIEAQARAQKVQNDFRIKMLKVREQMAKIMQATALDDGKIRLMDAQAQKALAEARGVNDGHKIAALEAAIGARKQRDEHLMAAAELITQLMKETQDDEGGSETVASPSGDQAPDGGA